jgi:hypothetical protein
MKLSRRHFLGTSVLGPAAAVAATDRTQPISIDTGRQLLVDSTTASGGRNEMAAHNDHDHLHREWNQRPKASAALEDQAARVLAAENSEDEGGNDTQQRDQQRIGEPSLALGGERETNTRKAPLPVMRSHLPTWPS